jgi:hypothetical protein
MKTIALLLLLPLYFLMPSAWAATTDSVITYTKPTKNDDGSNLTDISGYRLYAAQTSAGVATATPIVITGANTLTYTMTGQAPGNWFYAISTVSTSLGEGKKSNIATNVVAVIPALPLPPGNVTATTVAQAAYIVIFQIDRFVALPVGTIPADAPCDQNQAAIIAGVNYYAVPRASVTWSGNVRPPIVVAKCI